MSARTMAQGEFELIERYFGDIGLPASNLSLGPGDDAAVVSVPPDRELVLSLDTLVEGIHFDATADPADVAYKSLAVNLSDLAAMAAEPAWFLLSLTIPGIDTDWLEAFAASLKRTADQFGIALIGGDTCRGPLSISIQIGGLVPTGDYVTRSGASAGELILVSGEIGRAGLGLAYSRGEIELAPSIAAPALEALHRPHPRLELASFLRRYATAAIDLSDGLQADLGHLLKASHCGARLECDRLPVNPWIVEHDAFEYALSAGDDYEICCCVPRDAETALEEWNREYPSCPLSIVGETTASGYRLLRNDREIDLSEASGFNHFG